MKQKEINKLEELQQTCFHLVKDFQTAQIILLEGPLGSGKSQMVRYMVSALGFPEEQVCSPTFSLINVYKKGNANSIYHIDLYRLKKEEEIDHISFWDIFYTPTKVFIEWPRFIKNQLPMLWSKLFIQIDFHNNTNTRILKWKWK